MNPRASRPFTTGMGEPSASRAAQATAIATSCLAFCATLVWLPWRLPFERPWTEVVFAPIWAGIPQTDTAWGDPPIDYTLAWDWLALEWIVVVMFAAWRVRTNLSRREFVILGLLGVASIARMTSQLDTRLGSGKATLAWCCVFAFSNMLSRSRVTARVLAALNSGVVAYCLVLLFVRRDAWRPGDSAESFVHVKIGFPFHFVRVVEGPERTSAIAADFGRFGAPVFRLDASWWSHFANVALWSVIAWWALAFFAPRVRRRIGRYSCWPGVIAAFASRFAVDGSGMPYPK